MRLMKPRYSRVYQEALALVQNTPQPVPKYRIVMDGDKGYAVKAMQVDEPKPIPLVSPIDRVSVPHDDDLIPVISMGFPKPTKAVIVDL